MNDIDRWFQRAAKREKRITSLYASLLTGRIYAYFGYRLRYSLLLDTARFVVHVMEFLILLSSLGGLAAFTVMVLRVGSLIISGGWWGLLEVMRERLRGFARSGDGEAAEHEIGRWLILSFITATVLAAGAVVALSMLLPSDHSLVGHVYAVLVIVELAARLPVQVLHSGVYATRRIYRPIWSMIAPTAVQVAVLGVGFFLYPAAAMIVAIIAANAIGISITVHFTLEVYRLSGLRPKYRIPDRLGRRLLPAIPLRAGVQTTLAGLSLRSDGLIVLAILGIYGTNTRSFELTAGVSAWRHVDTFQFFYLVLPLFRGAYEATGLFYFDFVRLRRVMAFRQLQLVFFRRLMLTTPAVALYFWSLATVLGTFVLHDIPFTFLLALLPLFAVRSVIGTYQIRLFAEGHFGSLIATTGLLAALLWLVWLDTDPASDLLQITAAMLTVFIVLLNMQHFRDRREPPLPTLVTLGDWTRTLTREPGPVLVGRIVIPEYAVAQQKSAAVLLMQRTFDGVGHVAFRSSTTLLYYQRIRAGMGEQLPHLTLQAATGAVANRGNRLPEMPNGRSALDRLISERWIRRDGGGPEQPADPEALIPRFLACFPDGVAFDAETLDGARDMRALEQGLLAGALPRALSSLEDGSLVVASSGHWLTPIFHRGRLRLLCVLPTDPPAHEFDSWLRIVKAWHAGGELVAAEPAADG